jgi:hypothetical protein
MRAYNIEIVPRPVDRTRDDGWSVWEGGRIDAAHYRTHDWCRDHKANHICGTMSSAQAMPEFSPFHVELGEECGGCNFGGGIAQLDFRDMKFDWACG